MPHNIFEGIFLAFCFIGLATSIPMFFAIKSIGNIGQSDSCPFIPPIEREEDYVI